MLHLLITTSKSMNISSLGYEHILDITMVHGVPKFNLV